MKSQRYLAMAAGVAILAGATAVPAHAKGGGQAGGARTGGGMHHGGMQHGSGKHMGSGPGLAGVQTERPACGIPDKQIPLDVKCSPTGR